MLNVRVHAAIPASERAALIALYNSTAGDGWTDNDGWKTPPLAADGFAQIGSEGGWKGVALNIDGNTVIDIFLPNNNLTGTIPSVLKDLPNLLSLFLSDNSITDAIPAALGQLAKLQYLDMDHNELSGNLPAELGNLGALLEMNIYANQLSGSIPVEFGNLHNLQTLLLDINLLTNAIPAQLGNLTNLQTLSIAMNRLSGAIPPELGSLTALKTLNISENQLSGTIPASLGNLTALERFYLNQNALSGAIPRELGNLTKVRAFSLHTNQLSGAIPTELGNLSAVDNLSLEQNNLSGVIPATFSNLTVLEYLDLSENQLTGSIPATLENVTKLRYLILHNNQFTGAIPTGLGSLSDLRVLRLEHNRLTGNIPEDLGNLSHLYQLGLGSNRLSGQIPASLRLLNGLMVEPLTQLKWNGLYATDPDLRVFLTQKNPDWETTQTIAPTDLHFSDATYTGLTLNWNPILFNMQPGGYRVFIATDPAGPFSEYGITADKLASSMNITGLAPGTSYYFYIITRTLAHQDNANIVDSDPSVMVSAATCELTTLSGKIFHDVNANGVLDTGEAGLDRVEVILDGPEGFDNQMLASETGNYKFKNLLNGSYRVYLNPATLPSGATGQLSWSMTLTLSGYGVRNFAIRFGNEAACDDSLVFISGSPSWPGQGWENAVDGDLDGWDGTATVRGPEGDCTAPAWGLYTVACEGLLSFDRIRLCTDNGEYTDAHGNAQVQQFNRQAQRLEVWTSQTGQADGDFGLLTTIERNGPGLDQVYVLDDTVQARYFKLVITQPNRTNGGWRQLVEFMPELGLGLAKKRQSLTSELPAGFRIEQNYPNPFNSRTSIEYELAQASPVHMRVIDVNGRVLATLCNGLQSAGLHTVIWDAKDAPSGVYFCELLCQETRLLKRMLLVK